MMQLPIPLHRNTAVLETYVETSGAGHLFHGRLENLPALLGEMMVAGEVDPGLFGLDLPFTFGQGALGDEAQGRRIRARADELWQELQKDLRENPARAAESRDRYLRAIDSRLASGPRVSIRLMRRGAKGEGDRALFAGLFRAEDQALRPLNHPNVIRRYACLSDPRVGPVLFLEQIRGKTLERIWRRRLEKRQGPLPLKVLAHIAYQLVRAVAHAHGAGIVHGDLRPGNVLVEEPTETERRQGKAKGGVKLCGFGLAQAGPSGMREAMAGPGSGPLTHAAPEQLAEGVCTPATDVYQFGTTLYILATGRLPYDVMSLEGLRQKLLAPDPHPNRVHHFRPEISPKFEQVIEGAREKDPAKRWPLDRVLEAITQLYASRSFSLDDQPRSTSILEELLERVQTNAALKDFYRAIEGLEVAREFLRGIPPDKEGGVRRRYEELCRLYEPYRHAVNAVMRAHRQHIGPVDVMMEELYSRYGRGEPILTDEEKGIIQESGSDLQIVKRSLFDKILFHTSAAIEELGKIDPELVGEMHRKMVDRASSQEVAASDLAARMVKFGEDYLREIPG
jgi:serine/threonine protein kinase